MKLLSRLGRRGIPSCELFLVSLEYVGDTTVKARIECPMSKPKVPPQAH